MNQNAEQEKGNGESQSDIKTKLLKLDSKQSLSSDNESVMSSLANHRFKRVNVRKETDSNRMRGHREIENLKKKVVQQTKLEYKFRNQIHSDNV